MKTFDEEMRELNDWRIAKYDITDEMPCYWKGGLDCDCPRCMQVLADSGEYSKQVYALELKHGMNPPKPPKPVHYSKEEEEKNVREILALIAKMQAERQAAHLLDGQTHLLDGQTEPSPDSPPPKPPQFTMPAFLQKAANQG
ncbi:MAG: hypothetical protein FWG68_03785 [Defluviitaleaceae bacterium]|nr:hypothetical protein [Defluviitaleaceae bacterium]